MEALLNTLDAIEVGEAHDAAISVDQDIEKVHQVLGCIPAESNKVTFVDNGGSAWVGNHMATDFEKNVGVRSPTFDGAFSLT